MRNGSAAVEGGGDGMRRKLFTIAAGVSAVLCIAVCVLWVRSYVRDYDFFTVSEWGHHPAIIAGPDSVRAGKYSRRLWSQRGYLILQDHHYAMDEKRWYWDTIKPATLIAVPHVFVAGALAVAPALWCRYFVKGRRLARREPMGSCCHCGYDLRATPERCPECGTPAAAGGRGAR
jgi:hypothetical protein